jgi:hypothetical protein
LLVYLLLPLNLYYKRIAKLLFSFFFTFFNFKDNRLILFIKKVENLWMQMDILQIKMDLFI